MAACSVATPAWVCAANVMCGLQSSLSLHVGVHTVRVGASRFEWPRNGRFCIAEGGRVEDSGSRLGSRAAWHFQPPRWLRYGSAQHLNASIGQHQNHQSDKSGRLLASPVLNVWPGCVLALIGLPNPRRPSRPRPDLDERATTSLSITSPAASDTWADLVPSPWPGAPALQAQRGLSAATLRALPRERRRARDRSLHMSTCVLVRIWVGGGVGVGLGVPASAWILC